MRLKRAKQCSKILTAYSRFFGLNFKELEIFLDYTFVRQALINQVNIFESLCNMAGKGIRLVTSSCVISECKALGSLLFGSLKVLEGFKVLNCRHEYDPSRGAAWCIRKRIRTAKRHSRTYGHPKKHEKCFLFALASNDEDLRLLARSVPGMPLFLIAQRCINIEPIPASTQALIEKMTIESLKLSEAEVSIVWFLWTVHNIFFKS
uniref:rRNA-processing protein utp23 n=1 Tax=Schistocephalus solidus TaxID=70667 RepID=A0A0V0J7L5_SCHSO